MMQRACQDLIYREKCSLVKVQRPHISSARLERKTARLTITMPESCKNSRALYLERHLSFLDLDHAMWDKVCKLTQVQTESLSNKACFNLNALSN